MLNVAQLQPLLSAITLAEEISRDVASRQAAMAPELCPPLLEHALLAYRSSLMADLQGGQLAASVMGLQCVLERLACVALQPPPGQLARLADRLVPLRAFVLHQEAAHRNLGDAWVSRLGAGSSELEGARQKYVDLAHAVLEAGLGSLSCLAQDAGHYRAAVRRELEEVRQLALEPPSSRRSLK